MDDNAILNYHTFDGYNSIQNEDDIVRFVLDEQKHILTDEDKKILQDRENLRNELQTLQNENTPYSKEFDLATPWYADSAEPLTSSRSDVYFVDVEAIEHPSLTALETVQPSNPEIDDAIANFIPDENVKAEVLCLNEQINVNSISICAMTEEAKIVMMEKLNLKRKLANVIKRINTFSSEEVRVKRIKRKKGADCADTGHKKRTYFCRFGAPYFKTIDRFPVDRNPDLVEIVRTDQPMVLRLPRIKRFQPSDAAFLEENILKQLKAKRIEQLQKCLSEVDDRLKRDPKNDALANELYYITRAIKETEETNQISATKEWNIPVDFMALPQWRYFTGEDFERIWRLTGSPLLSHTEFSEDEFAELKTLVKKYNGQDWDQIASEMSTERSGFMCFTKYVAAMKRGKNKPWTKEENELLHNLCIGMDFVSKSDSRFQYWKTIRRHFPHRTYNQVHSHWTYVLEPRLKKGRFTKEENRLMLKLLEEGKTFTEIAHQVQNRSCNQIRAHFEGLGQNDTSHGSWTPQEEEKLLELVEKYGTSNWVTISKEMGTRNRSQCRLKYMLFVKNDRRFSKSSRAPKDYWTEEEDKLFKDLLCKYGTDFAKVSQEIPTKTLTQIRYKYHRTKNRAEYVDLVSTFNESRNKKCCWTDEEVEQFKELLIQYGPQYKLISKFFDGKDPFQLRYKYYSNRKSWNLSLPPVSRSRDGGNTKVEKLKRKRPKKLISALPSPLAQVSAAQENLQLPDEMFEYLVPVSNPDNFGIMSPQSQTDLLVLSSDPLAIQSKRKERLADSFCRPLQGSTTVLKPSKPKVVWTDEETEQFKQLLIEFGRKFKKISSIMQNKQPNQLRWKFNAMKNTWNLSLPVISKKIKLPKAGEAEQKQLPRHEDDVTSADHSSVSLEKSVEEASSSTKSSKKRKKLKSALPAPAVQASGIRKSLHLPDEMFEHLVPVSNPDNFAAMSPQTQTDPLAPSSDPLGISSENKERVSDSSCQPLQGSTAVLKPLRTKTVWTDEETEQLKQLLTEFGLQFKKISSIMQNKQPNQLRWKFYAMKNTWNLSLPVISKKIKLPKAGEAEEKQLPRHEDDVTSADHSSVSLEKSVEEASSSTKSSRKRKKLKSALPAPAVQASGIRKSLHLPDEMFEHLVPVSNPDNFAAMSPQTQTDPLAPSSDPLGISSENKERVSDSSCQPLQGSTAVLKPLRTKTVWTDEETEQLKQLLTEFGLQFKKISSIMQNKRPHQLRRKFYAMKKTWNLSLPLISKKIKLPKAGKAEQKQLPRHEDGVTSADHSSVSLEKSVEEASSSTKSSKKRKKLKSALPAPAVQESGIRKSLHLPDEMFEHLVPMSNPDNLAAMSPQTQTDPLAPSSDLLGISSENKERVSDSSCQPLQGGTAVLKPLRTKTVWTDEETEQLKQLLTEFGLQFKKISSIMQNKRPHQLRQKFYAMKKTWNLSLPVISKKIKRPKGRKVEPKQSPPLEEGVPTAGYSSASSEVPVKSKSLSIKSSTAKEKSTTSSVPRRDKVPASKLGLSKIYWTNDEVEKFNQLLLEYGPKFAEISKFLSGKTSKQVRQKYYYMKKAGKIESSGKSQSSVAERKKCRKRVRAPSPVPVALLADLACELPLPVELFKSSVTVPKVEPSSCGSSPSNLENGFAGFPDESEESSQYRELMPLRRIETIDHTDPGSLCEEMIVPEKISEMQREIGSGYQSSADSLNEGSAVRKSVFNHSELGINLFEA